jgi:hypothetical protein
MFVEGCVIDTYVTHVCVFLWNNHWVRHPSRCFDSMMKPAFSNLCRSAAITFLFGSSNHQRGRLTGLAFGSTFSACSTSSLGTPGMSEGHQPNISQRSRRNSMSTLSYAGSKFTAMEVVFAGSMG